MSAMQTVPVVDMREFRAGGGARQRFIRGLGEAFEGIGFATLIGHGIPTQVLHSCYEAARRMFSYSDEYLSERYETPGNGRQTGFTPMHVEHAKDCDHGDEKRFWHVREELKPGDSRVDDPRWIQNIWPTEVPEFKIHMTGLFRRIFGLSMEVHGALDEFLALPPGTLAGTTKQGVSLLRVLHYPALEADAKGMRSSAHEDINLVTFLVAATASGLEVRTRDGNWVRVNEEPGSIVLNVGDMLQMLTCWRMVSTKHRVVNLSGERYSMPLFVHPRNKVILDEPTDFTAWQYLRLRLKDIGLYGGVGGLPADELAEIEADRAILRQIMERCGVSTALVA